MTIKDAIDFIDEKPVNKADVLLRAAKLLRERIRELEALTMAEAERISAQSELLSKRAEANVPEANLRAVIAERDKAEAVVKKVMDAIATFTDSPSASAVSPPA